MRGRIMISSIVLVLTIATIESSNAGIFSAGLGNALRGAIVGNLIDGRNGAAAGAVIGGLIGAGEAASREKQQTAAAQTRQAEWQARQQAEQQRIRQQRAAAAPQETANQTLVIEAQKSLIRLGFEPGDIGVAGAELTNAVKGYQKNNGLLETGELSQPLLTHMLRNGG